jgi:uncharacterized protein (DUF885 family)
MMKTRLFGLLSLILLLLMSCSVDAERAAGIKDLCNEYIEAWKQFYPSRAFSRGFLDSIFGFEDYSKECITNWLTFNKEKLDDISQQESSLALRDRIDARLLRIQIQSEIDKWENETPHKNSPALYSRSISQAVRGVLTSELLIPGEKVKVVLNRLNAVSKMCTSAVQQLEAGSSNSITSSLKVLEESTRFYASKLPDMASDWITRKDSDEFHTKCRQTASQIRSLISHIQQNIKTGSVDRDSAILSRETYANKLRLFTDSDLTPEKLESMALQEIHTVKELMAQASTDYLRENYPDKSLPSTMNGLINRALKDMEQSHPASEQEYLKLWEELAKKAEEFIRTKKIATLPENQTLSITLAPESAGPMARIGWVSSAPPFQPNPWTTIYLPTIPDSFPEQERKEFWRSFNNYFTRFIVIHELFPGHYIQNKINRENPHRVRRLFPYSLYSEGWATLCEKVALDAGWDNNHKLTRLAQLRKRLENANRAYTSVKAHCHGWDREKVLEFSIDTSLLAPQFAKSLWGRLMRSPLQITTYFLGTQKFISLLEAEKKRQGAKFRTIDFMDTILRAGPIPLDEFPGIFKNSFQISQ